MVKISIIMPVYNDENNLKKSIGSVLNQTLIDFEIICIEDNSTVNSLEILNEFANNDNRIKVFSQESQGFTDALNEGISKATGEYIAFLDSSDYIVDENAYNQLYVEANKRNIDVVSGCVQFVNGNNIFHEFKTIKPIKQLNLKNVEDHWDLEYIHQFMFKREFLINNDIKFTNLLRGYDQVFLCEVLSKLNSFLEVPIIFYSYEISDKSKLNNSLDYQDYFLHFYYVFKLLMPQEKFRKLITDYVNVLISIKDCEVLVFAKHELLSLLNIMDNIIKLFAEFGDEKILKEIYFAFNEIIKKINIQDIDITINKPQNVKDIYSESIIVIDNSHKPVISLLMYVYDGSKYLPQCFESLLIQSFNDFEIICIDDGSSDNSLNILQIYAQKDSRIKVFSFTHKGKNHSFDRAIVRANGDYIIFVDPKNRFGTDFCEKIYQYNKYSFESKFNSQNTNESINVSKINELNLFNKKYQEYLQIKDRQIEMMSVDMKNIREDINNFREYNNRIRKDNENLKCDNDKLKEDITNLKGYNDSIRKDNENLKCDNDKLKEDITNLGRYNNRIMGDNGKLKEKNNYLESSMLKLNNQILERKKEEDSKNFQMKQLENQLNSAKLESEYFKKKGFLKYLIHPLSYIYLIYKSNLFEIWINIKLFRVLKNTSYFDVGFYFNKYPELVNTFCCKYFSPQLHYVCFGFNENKLFNKDFNCNSKIILYNKIHNK